MKRSHKTELRERPIKESYCAQGGCKFYGKHAVQGVCYSRDTFEPKVGWKAVEAYEKAGEELLRQTRAIYRRDPKGYTRALESTVISCWMNECLRLDETIMLRRRVALAEHKAKRATPTRAARKA